MIRMFLRLMNDQLDLLIVHFITDNALDLSIHRVNGHVLHQRCLLAKLPITNLASESLDSTVQSLMHPQTVGVSESLIANCTREHQLLVDSFVAVQRAGMSERRRTFLALERLVLFVLKRVALQIWTVLKQFAAQWTDESFVAVFYSYVILQIALKGEGLWTLVTLEPLVFLVLTPMDDQGRYGGIFLATQLAD